MDDFSISVHTLILPTQIHTHINYVSKFSHCRVKRARAVVIAATGVAAIKDAGRFEAAHWNDSLGALILLRHGLQAYNTCVKFVTVVSKYRKNKAMLGTSIPSRRLMKRKYLSLQEHLKY